MLRTVFQSSHIMVGALADQRLTVHRGEPIDPERFENYLVCEPRQVCQLGAFDTASMKCE